MTLPSDRRAASRHPWVLQVTYLDAEEVADFTENLSETGLFIRTGRPFAPGERTQLRLSVPLLREPLVLEVEVVWRRSDSPGLPAGVAVKVPADRQEDRDALRRLLQPGGQVGRAHILVAEDNPAVALVYAHALETGLPGGGAVTVEVVADGREAFARLQPPAAVDLLITDRFMPFMDGLTLLRRVRAEPRLRDLPVVMISADDAPDAPSRALALGTTVYLRKPVSLADVVRTVDVLLRKRR